MAMNIIAKTRTRLERAMGFEPTTLGLGSRGAVTKAASDAGFVKLLLLYCYPQTDSLLFTRTGARLVWKLKGRDL